MPPLAPNFPRRNCVIAGLARGTLVVEAGRDVFAIPGSIHSPRSRGCLALIKQGAKLVETAQDMLGELRWPGIGGIPAADAPPAIDPRLEALRFDPVTLDALVARTRLSAADLSVHLLDLELNGQVSRLPGQLFQRTARG